MRIHAYARGAITREIGEGLNRLTYCSSDGVEREEERAGIQREGTVAPALVEKASLEHSAYARYPPPGTFTQDFNTNFLRTPNSGTASTELANVSENRRSRGLQDPNPPAEAPESSGSSLSLKIHPPKSRGVQKKGV